MEFSIAKKRVFIVTQNLFTSVGIYLVNPTYNTTLSLIKSAKFYENGVNWTLVALPGKSDHLISALHTGTYYMLKIKLN